MTIFLRIWPGLLAGGIGVFTLARLHWYVSFESKEEGGFTGWFAILCGYLACIGMVAGGLVYALSQL